MAISVLSWIGHQDERHAFSGRSARYATNVIRARIAKMHNACLRNCQRCASMYEASLHLFVLRGAQSRFFVYARARELYLRRLDDESSHVRFDKDLRARYRNAICETLVRRAYAGHFRGEREFVEHWRLATPRVAPRRRERQQCAILSERSRNYALLLFRVRRVSHLVARFFLLSPHRRAHFSPNGIPTGESPRNVHRFASARCARIPVDLIRMPRL